MMPKQFILVFLVYLVPLVVKIAYAVV